MYISSILSQITTNMSSSKNKPAQSLCKSPSLSFSFESNNDDNIQTYINHIRKIHQKSDVPLSEEQSNIRLRILEDLAFLESVASKRILTDTEKRNLNVFLSDETHYLYPIAQQIQIRVHRFQNESSLKSINKTNT